ncbi:TPA: hypothetical protein I7730_15740 [Vibrio vulnificus]|uniref:Uncharacterized protein n=1 Tax=Vibrio vulnificus TaxID=672 RepID=A0A8H9N1W0_VIBVL|nr:hypothetical protein [Vibrio vulnificus]HAS8541234.1 hypothetical protein [Vibrio vulnificus]
MINTYQIYIVDSEGVMFWIPDLKSFIRDCFKFKGFFGALRYIDEHEFIDSNGKQVVHLLQEYVTPYIRKFYKGSTCTGAKRGGGNCFRHPKTTQELRMNRAPVLEEYEPTARGRRKVLPTVYDDIWRCYNQERNWKRYRKTQYI